MLNAVATLAGLTVLWLALTPNPDSARDVALGAVAVVAAALAALRWRALAPEPLSLTPLSLGVLRAARAVRGALDVMRAAVAPRAALRPGLVRLRTREASEPARAAFAAYVAAAPDVVLIDVQADGLLVHALDEDGIDAAELARTEARLAGEQHAS